MRLNYHWTDCEDGSHVAINYTVYDDRVSGSVRRWSADRTTNVGRKFEVPKEQLGRDPHGNPAITIEGVCAGPILVPLDANAVREAGLEWNRAA